MKFSELNRIAIIAALVWVIITILFVIIAFNAGKNPYGPFTLIQCAGLGIYTILLGLYIRAFKPNLEFGFQKAGVYSVIITAGSSILSLIVGLIYLTATWESSFSVYHEYMVDFYNVLAKSGEMDKIGEVNEEALQKNIESLKSVTAWDIVFNDFSLKMVTSLILSFIIAVVFRKSINNDDK